MRMNKCKYVDYTELQGIGMLTSLWLLTNILLYLSGKDTLLCPLEGGCGHVTGWVQSGEWQF